MGRELEYKYKGTEAAFAALEQRFGPFTPITMETTYYDTPDAALSNRRWTLRRRMENGVSVCTLKVPLSDGSRGEWEAEAPSIEAGVEALCALGAPGERLLADDLTDHKIDRPLRQWLPLVACGGRVLWVCGVGISQHARLKSDTARMVRLKICFTDEKAEVHYEE